MSDRLVPVCVGGAAQAAATGVNSVTLPVGMTFVGASVYVEMLSGSPTNVKFTLKAGAATIVAATELTFTAAGTLVIATPHLGGTATPAAVAAGTALTVDVAFTSGSTPKVDYDIVFWMLAGTK